MLICFQNIQEFASRTQTKKSSFWRSITCSLRVMYIHFMKMLVPGAWHTCMSQLPFIAIQLSVPLLVLDQSRGKNCGKVLFLPVCHFLCVLILKSVWFSVTVVHIYLFNNFYGYYYFLNRDNQLIVYRGKSLHQLNKTLYRFTKSWYFGVGTFS